MARSLKDYVIISLKGVAMGAADTVPGVSGGTIAFISGIYEELITTIGKVNFSLIKTWRTNGFSAMWKQFNGNFISALLLGILFSVFTIMRLTSYLLDHYPILIWSFFFGLVLASIWFVGRQINKWNFGTITALVLGAGVAYWITTFSAMGGENAWWFLLLAGALAICAMILPGISGAFILVLLGTYQEVTDAVSNFDFKKILLVAIGAIVGLLSFSKLLKWLFAKYKNITLAVLTGFIAGSLNKIWPWKEVLQTKVVHDKTIVLSEKTVWPSHFDGDPKVLYAFLLLVIGFLLIFFLEALANKLTSTDATNTDI